MGACIGHGPCRVDARVSDGELPPSGLRTQDASIQGSHPPRRYLLESGPVQAQTPLAFHDARLDASCGAISLYRAASRSVRRRVERNRAVWCTGNRLWWAVWCLVSLAKLHMKTLLVPRNTANLVGTGLARAVDTFQSIRPTAFQVQAER
ncbi:hypothetical protein OH76DRAFT_524974 [Lentinus brumalis]|uniref:Uncharacterized protein n=1 Tax=Lentinus brumalis TaxID=2498619 RepID=A0A371CHP5_9APHY|nr:hypothetical protein OH76DRAFT_524974 [Polyporus brumalis]